jgi:signal transduction histidine kinase
VTVSPGTGGDAPGERFFSSLAHELRTPLAVIVGYAELVGRRDDEAVRREASERILEAAERLSYALDDLLVVFAIEGDHLLVEVQPLDLEAAVRQAVRRFDGKGSGPAIALRAPATWPQVYGDDEHLGRVLTDVLRAARRRTPHGLEVEVAVSADGTSASIAVADGGPALSREELATLFEWPPARDPAAGGTGLELYKARRLVELQGGTISAASRPATGAIFTITLAIADENVP